jgi:hypothetical protein
VGTSIAARPPHRSVQAGLPHTALPLDPSVEARGRIRVKSVGTRNPSLENRPQMVPVGSAPLTTATQNMPPVAAQPFSEPRKHREVPRHGMIAVTNVYHPFHPCSDGFDRSCIIRLNSVLIARNSALIRLAAVCRQTTK